MTGASLQMTVVKAQKMPPVVDVPTAARSSASGEPLPTN